MPLKPIPGAPAGAAIPDFPGAISKPIDKMDAAERAAMDGGWPDGTTAWKIEMAFEDPSPVENSGRRARERIFIGPGAMIPPQNRRRASAGFKITPPDDRRGDLHAGRR
jgi:hypothetical protein